MTQAIWVIVGVLAVPVVLLLATTGCAEIVDIRDWRPEVPPEPPSPTYAETVLDTSGLLGYWRLGETNTADPAENSYENSYTPGFLDGVYVDPGITLGVEGALQDTNTAALFAGTTGYVEVPDMPPLSGGEVTVELWMMLTPTDVPDWGVLVGCYEPDLSDETKIATGYRLRVRTSEPGQFEIEANVGGMAGPLKVKVDEATPDWHYVVLTYSDALAQADLYIDDGDPSTLTGPFDVEVTTPFWQPLRFAVGKGLAEALPYPYAGYLDEVALYETRLPKAEVDNHYNTAKKPIKGS
jgi:Concanavalin A-like lectin/glucanases superfamily